MIDECIAVQPPTAGLLRTLVREGYNGEMPKTQRQARQALADLRARTAARPMATPAQRASLAEAGVAPSAIAKLYHAEAAMLLSVLSRTA